MDLVTKLLAQILDKFKAKNPKIFLIVQFALVAVQGVLVELDASDILPSDDWIAVVLKYVGYALMILVGSRTYSFVNVKTNGNSQGG